MNLLKNLPKATHTIQKIAKVTNILHSGVQSLDTLQYSSEGTL